MEQKQVNQLTQEELDYLKTLFAELTATFYKKIEHSTENNWCQTTSEQNIKVYGTRDKQTGLVMALGEGIVNCPVQQCKDLLLFDQKALKELRHNIEIIDVQKFSDFYAIQYKKTNGSLLFSSRDSATIRGYQDEPDGSVVITGISLEKTKLKDRQIPMKKDTTRTIIELVGYQLSPIMNNEKTKIISFLHMNLKGALSGPLPKFIINIGIKDTGQISKQINDYLQKRENQMKPKL